MARSFNGTSDLIAANAAHLYANSNYSAAFWAFGNANGGSIPTVFSEANTGNNNNRFSLDDSSGKLRVFINNSSGTTLLSATGTATAFASAWHHICFTQDGSTNYKTYIDGAVDLSGTVTAGTVSPNDLTIGALHRSATGQFYQGTICHVAIWSRTLSAGEALGLGNGLSPLLYGANHYWPLFGVDSPEPDLGISAHTAGTLTGTAFAAGHDPASLLDFAGTTVGV